jgi:transposase
MDTTQVARVNGSADGPILYMAIELARRNWLLGFSATLSGRPRRRSVEAYSLALVEEVAKTKRHLGLPEHTTVKCCLEAGRDAFAPVRWLQGLGLDVVALDAASIEVNRRKRRAKTDRIDVEILLNRLIRHHNGEPKVFCAVRQPTEAQEDDRRPHRELDRLTKERTQHRNRIQGLLATIGVAVKLTKKFPELLEQVRQPHGSALPANLKREILREWRRLELCEGQRAEIQAQLEQEFKEREDAVGEQSRSLASLRGIAVKGARVLVTEAFSWRELRNEKQVGALAGLAPSPWQTGQQERDQGISKTGNKRVRKLMIQLAWSWLRNQPESELSLWYRKRFDDGTRFRKVGVVALARKLLVALWRMAQHGVVPQGAVTVAAK